MTININTDANLATEGEWNMIAPFQNEDNEEVVEATKRQRKYCTTALED